MSCDVSKAGIINNSQQRHLSIAADIKSVVSNGFWPVKSHCGMHRRCVMETVDVKLRVLNPENQAC